MQGVTLTVSGVAVVSKVEQGSKEGWLVVELAEAPGAAGDSKWEKVPIRAKLRLAKDQQAPSEGSVLEIKGASLDRSPGEIEGRPTAFWNVTIFSWRSLLITADSKTSGSPATKQATKPKSVSAPQRPVMDEPIVPDDDEVPF